MTDYAPICLFTYNRLNETKQTILALKKNNLARKSDLIIFSDGPKKESDATSILRVRNYLETVNGFRDVKIYKSSSNNGLAKSIVSGVSKVLKNYDNVIVLEDDLATSSNFLDFMNQGLNFYRNHPKVYSISGYTMSLKGLSSINKDFYTGVRASSWGWATWDYIWRDIDWEVNDFESFISNRKKRKDFNKGGSDMASMLKRAVQGRISSWAIVFCYHQWKHGKLTVFPKISKVENIGFSLEASNTKYVIPEFKANLDVSNKVNFSFKENIQVDKAIVKAFAHNFSIYVRVKNKVFNLLRSILN